MKSDFEILSEAIMKSVLPKSPKRLIILVRETSLSEMFTPEDRFIAWIDGCAAGAMANTPIDAVKKLLLEQPEGLKL